MHASRILLFALLPLFASCQVFSEKPKTDSVKHTRLQGELSLEAGQLLFRPCQEQRRFVIANDGATGIMRDTSELLADAPGPLFADLRGQLAASQRADVDGQLTLSKVYRLQHEGQGCGAVDFKRTILHASGQEPGWSVTVTSQGMILNRAGEAPLALPYLEEQLPEGRLNLSSDANGQRLVLWAAPQRCIDSMSGAVQHMSAELRLNGEVMRGCAYFGGARND